MTKTYNILFYFLICVFMPSCSEKHPDEVMAVIEKAGGNKNELIKFLDYYKSGDEPLKYKAACFLIINMSQYSYTEFNVQKDFNNYFYTLDSLNILEGGYTTQQYKEIYKQQFADNSNITIDEVHHDIHKVTFEYLKKNLDYAFLTWENMPWAKHISFENFLEYVLPYRFGQGPLEEWRLPLFRKYCNIPQTETLVDPVKIADKINTNIGREFGIDLGFTVYGQPLGYSYLIQSRKGVCDDAVAYVVMRLRAIGIAASKDYTPYWANRNMGHSWNVVLSKDGEMIDFNATYGQIGYRTMDDKKAPKVFRKQFSRNPEMIANIINKPSDIPPALRHTNIIDVTDEYKKTSNVEIKIPSAENKKNEEFAFISVFCNLAWQPVYWGKIKKGEVVFEKMARDIVYLPSYYKNNRIIPFANPFILSESGEVIFLKANWKKTQTMVLKRKYPVFPRVKKFAEKMVYGRFQISNNPRFTNCKTIHEIKETPRFTPNIVELEKPLYARYIRYYSPDNGYCNISELNVFNEKQQILNGNIIGNDMDNLKEYQKVTDGNKLTYYNAPTPAGDWVGIDFGSRKKVKYIAYVPRTDLNTIEPGNIYELFVWDNNHWKSLGRVKAENYFLVYKNVPSNGLYWLRNLTTGREERIFTYQKEQQIWW